MGWFEIHWASYTLGAGSFIAGQFIGLALGEISARRRHKARMAELQREHELRTQEIDAHVARLQEKFESWELNVDRDGKVWDELHGRWTS
jgi:hypothetical protein